MNDKNEKKTNKSKNCSSAQLFRSPSSPFVLSSVLGLSALFLASL